MRESLYLVDLSRMFQGKSNNPEIELQNRCSTTELTRLCWISALSLPEFASALPAKSPAVVLALFASPQMSLDDFRGLGEGRPFGGFLFFVDSAIAAKTGKPN